jgi:hypothetical protein
MFFEKMSNLFIRDKNFPHESIFRHLLFSKDNYTFTEIAEFWETGGKLSKLLFMMKFAHRSTSQ